jgi:hypothetical protein
MNSKKIAAREGDSLGSPPPPHRKRGRRLRSAANVRALVAHALRQIEDDTSLPLADRARLLFYGSQVLLKAIDEAENERRREELDSELLREEMMEEEETP